MIAPKHLDIETLARWLHDACAAGSAVQVVTYDPNAEAGSIARTAWEPMARAVLELVEEKVREAVGEADAAWRKTVPSGLWTPIRLSLIREIVDRVTGGA